MSLTFVSMPGLYPDRLGSYLAALGVLLRLERVAPGQHRSFWRGCLHVSGGDLSSLIERIAEAPPLAILSPWNRDCRKQVFGLAEESVGEGDESDEDDEGPSGVLTGVLKGPRGAATKIHTHAAVRMNAAVRDAASRKAAIDSDASLDTAARKRLGSATNAALDGLKTETLRDLRRTLDDDDLAWLDALVVLNAPGTDRETAASPLGASIGCDGRSDFSTQYLRALTRVADLGRDVLAAPLCATAAQPVPNVEQSAGQFASYSVEAPNSGTSLQSAKAINPWLLVLLLEGLTTFCTSVVRRLDSRTPTFPFALAPSVVGSPSLAAGETLKREVWLPVWARPSQWREVQNLIAEGRVALGERTARSSVEARLGIARLGVARGIPTFSRFALAVRNGKSALAVPLHPVTVPSKNQPALALLDDDSFWRWLHGLQTAAAGARGTAARLRDATVAIERTLLMLSEAATEARWQELFVAIGQAQQVIASARHKLAIAPLRLTEGSGDAWSRALDDGSPRFRLAAALAAVRGSRGAWLPVDESGAAWSKKQRMVLSELASPERQVVAILLHALIQQDRRSPLDVPSAVSLADVEMWRVGTPEERHTTLSLARGLSVLPPLMPMPGPRGDDDTGVAWAYCRLALDGRADRAHGAPNAERVAMLRLLQTGQLARAVAVATHTLDVAAIRTRLRPRLARAVAPTQIANPELFVSSLCLPLASGELARFLLEPS